MNRSMVRDIGASKMPCPNCKEPLNFTVDKLFSGAAIKCRACDASMKVNIPKSGEGLAALEKAGRLLQQSKQAG